MNHSTILAEWWNARYRHAEVSSVVNWLLINQFSRKDKSCEESFGFIE